MKNKYISVSYTHLNFVQIYQFPYAGHENSLAVPIVTETMTDEDMQNNPRATVQQVYDQIMSDLNTADVYKRQSLISIVQNTSTKLVCKRNREFKAIGCDTCSKTTINFR